MSEPKKYRKKPVTIQAMRMPIENDQDAVRKIAEWMVEQGYTPDIEEGDMEDWDEMYVLRYSDGSLAGLPEYGSNFLDIETLEGEMTAHSGDYVIRGVQGEFYPCRADIFEQTHEKEGHKDDQ